MKNFSKVFLIVAFVACFAPSMAWSQAAAPAPVASASDTSLESLLFQSLPEVVTASKESQSIEKAPAVITVWTENDIKVMGIRTVKELLDRTAGFFNNMQYSGMTTGARGLIADSNYGFLLLVDGHNTNSILMKGAGESILDPVLAKAKRVEIVSGPGSTLWGTDAAMATINIITKDGSDIDSTQVTAEYATENGYKNGNILYGKKVSSDIDIMSDFSYWDIQGYPNGKTANGLLYPGNYQAANYNTTDWWGTQGRMGKGPILHSADSFEWFSKIRLGKETTFTASTSDVKEPDLWLINNNPTGRDSEGYSRKKDSWIELAHNKDIDSSSSLETKFFSDMIEQWDHYADTLSGNTRTTLTEDKESRSQNLGIDMLYSKKIGDVHNFKLGARFVQTEVQPVYNFEDAPDPAKNDTNLYQISVIVAPHTKDRDAAAFIEDQWQAMEKLSIVAGARVDNDNLLEKTTKVLPRAAVIYSIAEGWTAKYMFNTGCVRPPVNVGFLGQTPTLILSGVPGIFVGANKSEQIYEHDLQLLYNKGNLNFTVGLYDNTLNNFFNYMGVISQTGNVSQLINGKPYDLATINCGNLHSQGLETTAHYKVNEKVGLYGNYSFTFDARIKNFNFSEKGIQLSLLGQDAFNASRTMTGMPQQSWNLGTNVSLIKNISLNLNCRGWTGMWTEVNTFVDKYGVTNGIYKKLGMQNFVDANLLFADLFNKRLDFSLYAKNLLNNDRSKIGFPTHGGYWSDMGHSFGARATYKF